MAIATTAGYVLLFLVRRPTATTTHSIHLCRIDRVILISNSFTIITKKRMHVYTNLEFIHIMTIVIVHFFIVFKQWLELCWVATNDRKNHGQSMFTCSQY